MSEAVKYKERIWPEGLECDISVSLTKKYCPCLI